MTTINKEIIDDFMKNNSIGLDSVNNYCKDAPMVVTPIEANKLSKAMKKAEILELKNQIYNDLIEYMLNDLGAKGFTAKNKSFRTKGLKRIDEALDYHDGDAELATQWISNMIHHISMVPHYKENPAHFSPNVIFGYDIFWKWFEGANL